MKRTSQSVLPQTKLHRKLRKQFGYRHVNCRFSNRRLSSYGGYVDLINFSRLLELPHSITTHFHPGKIKHRLYSDCDLLQRLLDTVLLDVDRIDNADLLYNDELLRRLHGLIRDPSPATLRRELEQCYVKDIASLDRINADLLGSQGRFCRKKDVTLLIDLTPINSYGNQQRATKGYNKYQTDKCYQAQVGSIQETSDVITLDLKKGKFKSSAKKTEEIFYKCLSLLPDHLNVKRVRLDSGYWSFHIMNHFEACGLEYFVKAHLRPNTPLVTMPLKIPESHWIRRPDGVGWVSPKQAYYSSQYKSTYTVIFTREVVEKPTTAQIELFPGPVYKYHPLFSNSDKSELEILRMYNKGAKVEQIIKELKNEFFITKIASHTFKANYTFLKVKMIAYNLINAFKRLVLRGVWVTKSAKAIRNWFINVPCIIRRRGRGVQLIFADNLKLQATLQAVTKKVYLLGCSLVT
jgi:hypothetical protein